MSREDTLAAAAGRRRLVALHRHRHVGGRAPERRRADRPRRLVRLPGATLEPSIAGEPEMGWIMSPRGARPGLWPAKPARRRSTGPMPNFGRTPVWAIIAPGNEPSMQACRDGSASSASPTVDLSRRADRIVRRPAWPDLPAAAAAATAAATRRSAAARAAARSRRGRGRADRARQRRADVMRRSRSGLFHGLLLPEYQAKPCWPCAAAAASTPAKRSAQRFSTPSAIA